MPSWVQLKRTALALSARSAIDRDRYRNGESTTTVFCHLLAD